MSVFSLCVKAVESDSWVDFQGRDLRWLRTAVATGSCPFANAHTFWDASCTALRQLWRLASAIAFCIRCQAALNSSHATWERVLYQRLSSDFASFTLRSHQCFGYIFWPTRLPGVLFGCLWLSCRLPLPVRHCLESITGCLGLIGLRRLSLSFDTLGPRTLPPHAWLPLGTSDPIPYGLFHILDQEARHV
jgi:hypothetical protein